MELNRATHLIFALILLVWPASASSEGPDTDVATPEEIESAFQENKHEYTKRQRDGEVEINSESCTLPEPRVERAQPTEKFLAHLKSVLNEEK